MKKLYVLFLIVPLVFVSCKKKPVAGYEIELLNCESPYEVKFHNRSENFDSYNWTINQRTYDNYDPVVNLRAGDRVDMALVVNHGKHADLIQRSFYPEDYYLLPTPNFSLAFEDCENYRLATFCNTSKGEYDAYFWDFGDGSRAFNTTPVHEYLDGGTYDVRLYLIKCKDTLMVEKSINVTPENVFPEAEFSYLKKGQNPSGNLLFIGNQIGFNNQSENATEYFWDFGDGHSSSFRSPSHVFNSTGTYDVTLTVACGDREHSVSKTIVVKRPSSVTIESVELTRFPQLDGGSAWDPDLDEDDFSEEVNPDIYLRIMKGACEIYVGQTFSNVYNRKISWNPDEKLTNLGTEYELRFYDRDDITNELMGEIEFEPEELYGDGNYPTGIKLSSNNGQYEVNVVLDWN